MLRILARFWAKRKYIFSQEVEAVTNDLNAGLAIKLAGEKRALIEKLNNEADEIDANIKSMDEKLDNGIYECEIGHDTDKPFLNGTDSFSCPFPIPVNLNGVCAKPMKFIKRDQMTGQEKYESDKERKAAEKIAADKRAQAAAEEANVSEGERTAKYFKGLADNNRRLADKIRRL